MNETFLKQIAGDNIKVISISPAVAKAKMYNSLQFPILIKRDMGRKNRAPIQCYGALVTLDINDLGLKILDRYEGCSKSILGYNSPFDLYHREEIEVRKIKFDSIKDFLNMKLEIEKEKHKCIVYIGNMENDYIRNICMDTHKRIIFWKTFLYMFDK